MQISSMLTNEEIHTLQQKFYEYFETGYAFEEFLKAYLLKMGLDEVEVTRRSRDGGIDLTAIRKGVGDFSDIDITHYYIQAKKYKLKSKINVKMIRELKGTIPFGYKGMFITTSDFTNDATSESTNDPSKPVVIINGNSLVTSCIDNEIGFVYKPIFSENQMDLFLNKESLPNSHQDVIQPAHAANNFVEKIITSNDIRARIVSIPSSIMSQLNEGMTDIDVLVNGTNQYHFNIIRGRNYFGGVTSFLKDFKMLSDEGIIIPKHSRWQYDEENTTIRIIIEE